MTYASDVKLSSLNEITERLVGLIRYYILLMIIMPTESHPNYTVCFLKLNSVIGLRQKAKRCANYSYNRTNFRDGFEASRFKAKAKAKAMGHY